MGTVSVPLHWIHLSSDLITGRVRVGVMSDLPVKGVDLLLGNDLVGGRVIPMMEVLDTPDPCFIPNTDTQIYPTCVLTRAQARRTGDIVDISPVRSRKAFG